MMTSLFKKLFGKNEIKTEPEISLRVEIMKTEIANTVSPIDEIKKSYNISEIKKQSTQIKDNEGFLSSINFIKEFIEANKIQFDELISLLKKIVSYMKKEKTISEEDILKYIHTQIERFEEKSKVEYLIIIADILSRVNNRKGLEYLEKKLGDFETDNEKSLIFFDALILLSDFYLFDKQSDKAFRTIRRALLLVTNFSDKFDYLWKQKVIAEKFANFSLYGQKNPQYAEFIHYEIVAFILEIARDVIAFPHLSGFFHRKYICFNDGWCFEENEDFNNALEDLKISRHKKELLNDIYNFTFNDLPIMMGIPKEFFHENVLEPLRNLSEDHKTNYPKWRKISEASKIFNNRPFDEIGTVYEFSSTIVKKYYDMENKYGR
jgi:hypothetical protein